MGRCSKHHKPPIQSSRLSRITPKHLNIGVLNNSRMLPFHSNNRIKCKHSFKIILGMELGLICPNNKFSSLCSLLILMDNPPL